MLVMTMISIGCGFLSSSESPTGGQKRQYHAPIALSCCLTKKGHASWRMVSFSVRPELTCSWFCVYHSDIEIKGWEQEASRERSSTYLESEEEEQHERSNNSKWSFSTASCTGAKDSAP